MKKNRKKLPRYWLGTRMPASLGYQPNQGAGNVSYSTKLGEDFTAEANAAQANILPSAINRLQQSTTPLMNMWQNSIKATAPGAAALSGVARAAAKRAGESVVQFAPDVLPASAPGSISAGASSAGNVAESAGATAGKTVFNAAGKAIGVIGGAYGLANMAMDFAHNKDHRTAANMWDTVNTSTYTTDKGNSYNTYSAPNLQAELDYASAQKTSKNVNNTINAVGTGAAIGGTIGSIIPGIGNVVGTIAGSGVGALYGLGSWLFGFGDTYEDVMNEYRKTQDVAALKSLQSEASAKNKDVKQGFYDRSNPDGRVGAAKGKKPIYGRGGKTNAKVSNGEWIGNLKEGWVQQVPGEPNNNDTENANLKSSDYVISNPFVPLAAATGDIEGTLILQDMYNRNKQNFKQAPMKAKCGKMPKYNIGKWGDYALSTLPNLGAAITNLMQYNRANNASVRADEVNTETPEAEAAINQGLSNTIDLRPYLNRSMQNYNQAAWNIRRDAGLGRGQRLVSLMALNRNRQLSDIDARMAIEKYNNENINKWLDARVNLSKFKADKYTSNRQKSIENMRQAVAAQDYYKNVYSNNALTAIGSAAADALRTSQFHQAQDIKNRELEIWQQPVDLEKLKRYNDLARMGTNNLNPVQNFIRNWFFAGNRI